MELELVSFKLCPYVQRSVITLKHKGRDFSIKYIDLADPPQWFTEISPFGKVPVLQVRDGDREEVLFESAVINEFVDEVTGGDMMPKDPITKALNRAWIEFASACFVDVYMMSHAANPKDLEQHREALAGKLDKMEAQWANRDGPFWNGSELNLIDTAVAPLFMRLQAMEEFGVTMLDATRLPKLNTYANRLLALPEVQQSVVPEFHDLNRAYVKNLGGALVAAAPASA